MDSNKIDDNVKQEKEIKTFDVGRISWNTMSMDERRVKTVGSEQAK